jgi:Peptidase MA superfamily
MSSRAWARWMASFGRLALVVLAWVSLSASPARADEPVASPPRDAPLFVPSGGITIPPVPASYQTRDLGWMTIAYPPSVYERVRPLIEDAPAFKAKLADVLGQTVLEHVDVRIARGADEMAAMAPREAPPFSYAVGMAYTPLHLVTLSLTSPTGAEATDLESVFRHELFHVALEDAVRGHHVPLWFNEGMAIYESDENRLLRIKTLWDASLSRTIIPLADLDRSFPSQSQRSEVGIAYAESADFVRFLLRDQDQLRFAALIERVRGGQPFDRALGDAYDVDLRKLEYQWREDMAKRYTFAPVLASGSLIWVAALVVLGFGYAKKRKRDKATLARWELEDTMREATARGVLQEPPTLPLDPSAPRLVPPSGAPPGLPKIEHEGSWHTLH